MRMSRNPDLPPEHAAMLVLVSGLPGVGKSSLVDSLAPRIGAVVISRDQARLSASHVRRLMDSVVWSSFTAGCAAHSGVPGGSSRQPLSAISTRAVR
jgi:2-phosphoglycerate kinase